MLKKCLFRHFPFVCATCVCSKCSIYERCECSKKDINHKNLFYKPKCNKKVDGKTTEVLEMKDLYIGKIVNSSQIRKFQGYVIVLGHTRNLKDERGNLVIEGEIVFVGKKLSDFHYKRDENEETFVKTAYLGRINIVKVNKREERDYKRLFDNKNKIHHIKER